MNHCCKQCTYFFSVKTCGNSECTTFQPARLPPDISERLHHLSDFVPIKVNEGYYWTFQSVYSTETIKEFVPSKKTNSKQRPIVGRWLLTPYFMKTPLYSLSPLFQILTDPLPSHCCFCYLAFLAEWMIVPHLMCYFT